MAKIVNLGSPGQPRESAMSGFASTFSAVSGARENRARTGIMQQEADVKGQEATNRTQQLKNEFLKAEREEKEKNRKLATETLDRISLILADKSPAEQQALLDSPPIQEITKQLIKPYLPESYNEETKRLIPLNMEWLPKTREEKLKFKEDIAVVNAKVKANAPLSAGDLVTRERSVILAKTMGMISLEEAEAKLQLISEQMDKLSRLGDKVVGGGNGDLSNGLKDDIAGPNVNQEWWNK